MKVKTTTRNADLEPGDPGSFKGMRVLPRPDWGKFGDTCPKCKGHGGWHITLDAYGKGKHFDAFCSACWGYGYLAEGQTCAHEFGAQLTAKEYDGLRGRGLLGNCLNPWKCRKCGFITIVDSSD